MSTVSFSLGPLRVRLARHDCGLSSAESVCARPWIQKRETRGRPRARRPKNGVDIDGSIQKFPFASAKTRFSKRVRNANEDIPCSRFGLVNEVLQRRPRASMRDQALVDLRAAIEWIG
jgi:hypothetical protein